MYTRVGSYRNRRPSRKNTAPSRTIEASLAVATIYYKREPNKFFPRTIDVLFFYFTFFFFVFVVINWIAFRCSVRRDGAIKNTQGERVANHVKRGGVYTAALSEGTTETHRRDSPFPRWNCLLRSRHYWATATPFPGLGSVPGLIVRPVPNGRLGECNRTRCCRSSLPGKENASVKYIWREYIAKFQ